MGTSIVLTSGKGGTGKTACCAAISTFLASLGRSVVCVDCDAAMRDLDLALGLPDSALWDFLDVTEGRVPLEDALTAHPSLENLWFLAAPTRLVAGETEIGDFLRLIGRLKEQFDFVLLDSPAGIGQGFQMAASAADIAVIVATGDITSLRDGQRAAQELRALGVPELRLLVNRVRPRTFRRMRRDIDQIIDTVGARLIGVVSEDAGVSQALNREEPLITCGARDAWGQLYRIARRLNGEKVRLGRIR